MRVLFALFIIIFSHAAQAQYKCVENGRTWYTNVPCQVPAKAAIHRIDESKTAAEIQAEFEREVAEKQTRDLQAAEKNNLPTEGKIAIKTEVESSANSIKQTSQITAQPPRNAMLSDFAALILFLYFVPGIIAFLRTHHNTMSIWATNILLGWTFIGWAVALIWALTAVKQKSSQNSR